MKKRLPSSGCTARRALRGRGAQRGFADLSDLALGKPMQRDGWFRDARQPASVCERASPGDLVSRKVPTGGSAWQVRARNYQQQQ
jgi:hypothetical protein